MKSLNIIPSPARWADVIRYALLVVVVLDSALLYQSFRSTQAVTRNMENNVIEEQVFSDLKDAECGQRGFLFTEGDERYLPQYYVGVENTRADLVILEQYLSDDQGVKPLLEQLRRNVTVKLGELDATVRAYRSGDPDRAREIVRSGTGLAEMEMVRTTIGILRAHEQNELRRRWSFF